MHFEQFINNFNKPKNWLILANVFLVFFLIVLGNTKVIPLETGDFIFFSILTLAFALYRPGWAFLFFCGTIPLENINLAPISLGLMIRPYQFIGGILILALLIRKLSGRLNFKLPKFNFSDWAVLVLVVSGFLSAVVAGIGTQNFSSLRMAIILVTFVALYFLTRMYIQDAADLKKTIPFFLSSALVVVFYGIWQNIAFLHGGSHFEAMPGRPNGTFAEADWLGIYLVMFISILYAIFYRVGTSDEFQNENEKNLKLFCSLGACVALIASYVILILTVSRSAWLAAFAAYIIFIWIFFTGLKFKNWKWKETSILKLKLIPTLLLAIGIVFAFHLTDFQLGNRIQSTGTGLQKITVSCADNADLPGSIQNVAELEKFNCRHINLEEIDTEKAAGNLVTEVYRKDPNVSIRAQIYQKSWEEIKNHWLLGIGWGNIGALLGTDARGAVLNSSNIFLEVWLGAGIIGLLAFLFLFGHILFRTIKNYFYTSDQFEKALTIFLISSWFGIVIFNLFNAGIFLGFLWVWLAIANLKMPESN